jgi:hypothetical protein
MKRDLSLWHTTAYRTQGDAMTPPVVLAFTIEQCAQRVRHAGWSPDLVKVRLTPDAVPIALPRLLGITELAGLPVVMPEEPARPGLPPCTVDVDVIDTAAHYHALQCITAEAIRDSY